MRSWARARRRDLIEAGLSEPAGWRARSMGIVSPAPCPRRLIGRVRAAFDRPMAIDGSHCERLKQVGSKVSSVLRAAAAVDRVAAVLRDDAVPAGVASVRGECGNAAEHGTVMSCRSRTAVAEAREAAGCR